MERRHGGSFAGLLQHIEQRVGLHACNIAFRQHPVEALIQLDADLPVLPHQPSSIQCHMISPL